MEKRQSDLCDIIYLYSIYRKTGHISHILFAKSSKCIPKSTITNVIRYKSKESAFL